MKVVSVPTKIRKDLSVGEKERRLGAMAQIAETGQETTGVRHHRGPDPTAGGTNVPLAPDLLCLFENHRLEPVLFEIPRGDKASRPASNDGYSTLAGVSRDWIEDGLTA